MSIVPIYSAVKAGRINSITQTVSDGRSPGLSDGLRNDAANQASTAATQCSRLIGMVVATGVNHQRSAFQVTQFEAWGEHGLVGFAIHVDVERRQVAEVAFAPGKFMFAGFLRVVMASGGEGGDFFAVFFLGKTTGVFVDVKSMEAHGQSGEFGGEDDAIFAVGDDDLACAGANAVGVNDRHGNGEAAGEGR
jgi:hypothetical protein